ncbi:MAG: hypothetical protein ABIE22_02725 [archaeon]
MVSSILTHKKGQVWSIDVAVAVVIFLVGAVMIYFYAINISQEASDKLDALLYEGNYIGEILLDQGSPQDWDNTNVVTPGLTTANRINQTKLDYLNFIIIGDYDRAQRLLGTQHYFFINFSEQMTVGSLPVSGLGNPPSVTAENIVKVTRFSVYESKPIQLNIYVWN